MLLVYICEMTTMQKEMGKGFSLQTTQAQRDYTILEIKFEFMFVKAGMPTLSRQKSGEHALCDLLTLPFKNLEICHSRSL